MFNSEDALKATRAGPPEAKNYFYDRRKAVGKEWREELVLREGPRGKVERAHGESFLVYPVASGCRGCRGPFVAATLCACTLNRRNAQSYSVLTE